jgi:hypothetical protein
MRRELGAYLWVQEFQVRGVVHYHALCEGEVSEERVALSWCRATEELDDAAALKHATKVDRVESQSSAKWYLARYIGKARQKLLPAGVEDGWRQLRAGHTSHNRMPEQGSRPVKRPGADSRGARGARDRSSRSRGTCGGCAR